ncbi:uncharacterized protein LOC127239771 isoform X2 [Andrographis paniculata]|uniref:uncharacterized protein LOC127239771 isoform X2 n=1 Tax=Andrographis paniculata TaxID=175694 RepID=UPI0021E8CFBE|nr:uncharacterized protein LOC127239771 isoform X2 [Andrographis paniculata]
MPGAIQVTVLEFKGIGMELSPSSKTSLKVSMGKREFRTFDNGHFSFPIAKLNEDLSVALLDAADDEIARSDIRTMQIIEKGSWDDVFSIGGCGHVRMQLQFVLSEEDRHRIRAMRESVVKKKLGANPNIARTSADRDKEIECGSDSATDTKEQGTDLEAAIPDTTDGGSAAPLSRSISNKIEPQSLADEEDTSCKSSESDISDSLQESRTIKVQSTVRKMISAFESSQIQLKKTPSVLQFERSRKEPNVSSISPADETSVLSEEKGSENPNVEKLQNLSGDSVRTKSLECYNEECASAQCSGIWIFPENTVRLCVTAAGNEHLMKISNTNQQPKIFSPEIQLLENETHATEHKMEDDRSEAAKISESGHDCKTDASSNKLVGKVIKLAAILGFGLLVLLTRQREPRDSKPNYRKKKKNAEEFNKLLAATLD